MITSQCFNKNCFKEVSKSQHLKVGCLCSKNNFLLVSLFYSSKYRSMWFFSLFTLNFIWLVWPLDKVNTLNICGPLFPQVLRSWGLLPQMQMNLMSQTQISDTEFWVRILQLPQRPSPSILWLEGSRYPLTVQTGRWGFVCCFWLEVDLHRICCSNTVFTYFRTSPPIH